MRPSSSSQQRREMLLSQRSNSNMMIQNQHSLSSYLQVRENPVEEYGQCQKSQTINDALYGQIKLPPECTFFMNQKEMQRLKNIFQLGPNFMVYPGATHNRFEHSLGTAYLCDEQMKALKAKHKGPSPLLTDREHQSVVLAGLFHDLGHGIYSHLFDRQVMRAILQKEEYKRSVQSAEDLLCGADWEHEDASQMLIQNIYDRNEEVINAEVGLQQSDFTLIKELVKGESSRYMAQHPEKRFLFDIVSNKRNSFDLDKLDYLNRDLQHTGINDAQVNYRRIIDHARVIENRICYDMKVKNEIHDVFQRRFELFKQVYLHKTCMAIESMVAEALILANPVYHFERVIYDPEAYVRLLHDDLLHVIRKSRNPDLQDSAKLLKRIQNRDLYKCVGEISVHKDWRKVIKAEDIASCQDMNFADGAENQLRPEDLIVTIYKLDWGNNEEYPLDLMYFFKQGTYSQPEICSLPRHETNQQRPKQNYEYRLRVYVKESAKEELARQAFQVYAKMNQLKKRREHKNHSMIIALTAQRQGSYPGAAAASTNNSATLQQAETDPVSLSAPPKRRPRLD